MRHIIGRGPGVPAFQTDESGASRQIITVSLAEP
jgi:hypothetical protein